MPVFPTELIGDRLRLYCTADEHVDDILSAIDVSFPELHTWMAWAETMPTHESLTTLVRERRARFNSDERWSYWIRELDGDQLVGSAGLQPRGVDSELEIGYWIRSDRTGRGYASEAAAILTSAAFDTGLAVTTVKISMDRANAASAAVPRKLGFLLDEAYERDVVTPAHSGEGVAWVMTRERWLDRSS
jgi:RimJ/RimL family protein N-acetyltransferase